MNVGDLGPGWQLNGFVYLAGDPEALDELRACVSAWSFLVPHARWTVLGRNAYGALLLREGDGLTYLLDPEQVVHRCVGRGSDLDVPGFLDHARYDTWRVSHPAPGIRDVLVPVGGELVVTDIVSYYASTGATHEHAYTVPSVPFPGFPEFPEPEPLDDGRSWTARFDSWNQRLDDIYYVITVDSTSFMAQLYVWVDPRLPVYRELIRRDLREIAATGRTNTEHHR